MSARDYGYCLAVGLLAAASAAFATVVLILPGLAMAGARKLRNRSAS